MTKMNKMTQAVWLPLVVVGALGGTGCASTSEREQQKTETAPTETQTPSTQPEGQPQAGGPGMRQGMPGNAPGDCPMIVEGATVRAEDTEGGGALVFTTTGNVEELRTRVVKLAEMHNRMHMQGDRMMAESTARVEMVEGGARIVLTATNPANVEALRSHMQTRADNARPGVCPMRMGPGAGAATG